MASQVLSGTSNPSYTNNTGQNVRIIINYMRSSSNTITLNWANNATATSNSVLAIGKDLCFFVGSDNYGELDFPAYVAKNFVLSGSRTSLDTKINTALPTEIMLSPNQTFSASCGIYNILVITES